MQNKYYLFLQTQPENKELYHKYHSEKRKERGDSGVDLFFTKDQILPANSVSKIDLEVNGLLLYWKGETVHPLEYINYQSVFPKSSYWLIPRSSIVKTPLILKNSLGLIDSEYQGNLMVFVLNHSNDDYEIKRGQSLFQLTTATLEVFEDVIISEEDIYKGIKSKRGSGGFGSTNEFYESLKKNE